MRPRRIIQGRNSSEGAQELGVQLVKDGGSFVALTGSYKDGAIVKAAGGFRWGGMADGKGRWIAQDRASARLLAQFAANDDVRAELEAQDKEQAAAPAEPAPLMRLERHGAEYRAIGGYEANPVIRAAGGFRWNPAARCWATKDMEAAAKLARFAEPALREELETTVAQARAAAEIAIEASRATDAEVEIPAPAGLAYLGYQKAGIAFALRQLALPDIAGVLIGDDMGLGKTIQGIGIVNARPDIRKVLILCPASLKLNWQREWRKWSVRPMTVELASPEHWPAADVVIVNYDIVHRLRDKIDAEEWDLLIADECHVLKTKGAIRTVSVMGGQRSTTAEERKAILPEATNRALEVLTPYRGAPAVYGPATPEGVRKAQDAILPKKIKMEPIRAAKRVWLTGTPILNRPVEMWTIIEACDPKGLGADFFDYAKRYCDAHRNSFGYWDFGGASNLDELQMKLRSRIMVRRLKADVLTELPAKRRQLIELAAEAAGAIVAAEKQAVEALREAIAKAEADMILAEAEGDAKAYKRAVERLKSAQTAAFTEMSKLRHQTAVKKIPYLIEHIREAVEASGKVIVFAHHADVLAALKKEFGEAAVVITGQTSIQDRQAAVDAFQADPKVTVFLGNIIAAGVGLTLTASSHVIFGELDWRPGMVTQAEDRAHRIGQKNSVLVQHIVFEGSIDAEMAKRIVAKQEVIDKALDVGAAELPAADDGGIDAVLAEMQAPALSAEERAARVEAAIAAAARPSRERTGGEGAEGAKPRWQIAEEEREKRWAALDGEAAEMTAEQIAAVQDGLRMMTASDTDMAMELNGVGFNKADSYAGHALAAKATLTPRQAAAARKMMKKYHKQLGIDLLAEMGVALREKGKAA